MDGTTRALLWTYVLSCSCAPAAAPERTQPSARVAEAVATFLDRAVAEKRVVGAAAAVARADEIVAFETAGMADREAGRPLTEDTIFRIASMSKPITSVGVMILVEEGRLSLDDPASVHIPGLARARVLTRDGETETREAASPVTIRHLLTHTSGLTYRFVGEEPLASLYADAGVSDGLAPAGGTLEERMTRLASLPLLHDPGARWSYGLSTDLLGFLIERVSGRTLDVFLQEEIFEPLDMDDTGFFVDGDDAARLAAVYAPDGAGGLERLGEEPITDGSLVYATSYPYREPHSDLSGGAGLVSTLGDYLRFARMLAGGGELEGVRILEEETVRLMTRDAIGPLGLELEPGTGFGLGVAVETSEDDTGGLGAFGWGGIFHTSFWVDPDRDLIGVFMTQLAPADTFEVPDDFRRAVYEAL